MIKNKKGFTLIELLVAIALMISITVVAIVSITKVSEGSKEQSYELVKEEVKTAALEYFSANEYWFEGLENGSTGYITVTKLVEEGYLNSLTNPTTGEKLNGCDYVEVKKTDNGYQYNFLTDNSGTCKDNNSLTVMEPNAPNFTLMAKCDSNPMNPDDWCNKDVTISLDPLDTDENNISSKEYSLSNSTTNSSGLFPDNFRFIDKNESSSDIGTTLTATVSNGKKTIKTITYKIDKTEPTCAINTSENNIKTTYNRTENVKFELKSGDALSGVKNKYISTNAISNITDNKTSLLLNNININNFTLYGKVVDNAGNEKDCNTIPIAIVAPNCKTEVVSNDSDGIRNGWYNGANAPVIKLYVNDEYKTYKTATEGDRNYTFNDEYGCGYNPTVNVKYDKTGPVLDYINIRNAGLSSTTSWTNQTATFDVKTYDQLSGINTNGANGGLFWLIWNSGSGNDMSNGNVIYSDSRTYSGDTVDLSISNGVYTRLGGSLSGEGRRKQYYESCDKAGNCTGKIIYANIDKTPPVINYVKTAGEISTTSNANAKWTNATTKYDVKTYDTLSGINTNANFGGSSGIYYVTWNTNSGTSLTNSTVISRNHADVSQTTTNGYTTYVRNNGGLASTGKRKQVYRSCDLAGNCKDAAVYVNSCNSFNSASTTADIKTFISTSLSVKNLNSSKRTKVTYDGSGGATSATFTFTSLIDGIKIRDDISGAYCNGECGVVGNHAGWNVTDYGDTKTKETSCASKYNCAAGWNYVASCAIVTCGDKTSAKKVCYRKNLGATSGYFYKVLNYTG